MISANELRKMEPQAEKKVLDDIEDQVIKAQMEGKRSIWLYKTPSYGTQKVLEKAGYKIDDRTDQRDGIQILISW